MDDWEKVVAEHWSQDLLDNPSALVSVIETKISRAVLAEQRRIVDLLIAENVLEPTNEFDYDVLRLIRERTNE